MICSRCLSRAAAARHCYSNPSLRRSFTSYLPRASVSAAAEPFTTPIPASPTSHDLPAKKKSPAAVAQSSVPAGTPLRGLNFFKDKSDPVAMEDSEYPDWLWTIVKDQQRSAEGGGAASAAKLSKKAVKKAAKKALLNEHEVKVPIHEQTVDLYAGDGTDTGSLEAQKARRDLTKAMRAKRRASIKEDNFLRLMG